MSFLQAERDIYKTQKKCPFGLPVSKCAVRKNNDFRNAIIENMIF